MKRRRKFLGSAFLFSGAQIGCRKGASFGGWSAAASNAVVYQTLETNSLRSFGSTTVVNARGSFTFRLSCIQFKYKWNQQTATWQFARTYFKASSPSADVCTLLRLFFIQWQLRYKRLSNHQTGDAAEEEQAMSELEREKEERKRRVEEDELGHPLRMQVADEIHARTIMKVKPPFKARLVLIRQCLICEMNTPLCGHKITFWTRI